jgi:transcriptional regulator with XRE-family HTH domain
MDASEVLRSARARASLSLRELAKRAGTSHATLAAYEAGRKTPSFDTLNRIVRASGQERGATGFYTVFSGPEREAEILQVLELAAAFPSRHTPTLECPVFGR